MAEEVSLKEMQQIGLEGLLLFRDICEKYKLRYFLAYGTLLGAIRHKGFIPWDDDVDILMPREDYKRFLSVSKKEENSAWEILSYERDEGYWLPWAKMCNKRTMILPSRFHSGRIYGVSIDIFPLDFFEVGTIEELKQIRSSLMKEYLRKVQMLQPYAMILPGRINRIKGLIKRLYFLTIGKKVGNIPEMLKECEKSVPSTENGTYAMFIHDRARAYWRTDYFMHQPAKSSYATFEGERFCVPDDSDAVLKAIYGDDYMIPPPPEKRVSVHSYQCLYTNTGEKDGNASSKNRVK